MRNGISKNLIERILGQKPKWTLDELEKMFPQRVLDEGAYVTRVAPSPTGFMHLGTLYQMLIAKKIANQSNGVFMLRIEDTDSKREVAGAAELIVQAADLFGLNPDEGLNLSGEQIGNYGPYVQSQRGDIYKSVAAQLLENGLAYPCFLTSDEMEAIRDNQKAGGFATGIYGEFAKYRNITEDEITEKMDNGEIPTIRLYSTGNKENKIFFNDKTRGRLALPENDEDIVLIKSNDGLPTYHFAHLVDDHFMRTNLVQRGEEWLPSLNLHLQLFKMMNWDAPDYIHVATINKLDETTGNSRKLSKRLDTEANVMNYLQKGYPIQSVLNYLYNIVASGFEEEVIKKPNTNIWNYPLRLKKIPISPALFGMPKLEWWAREYIATLSIDELFTSVMNWIVQYGGQWNGRVENSKEYLKDILAIERDNPKRIRKDFINWSQTMVETAYFWDDIFTPNSEYEYNKNSLSKFLSTFDINDDKDVWWNKIVEIASGLEMKSGDVAMNLRVAITGRTNAPDLYSVMKVMGEDRVISRIKNLI